MAKLKHACQQCGEIFEIWPSQIRYRGGKYCSRQCYYASGYVELCCEQCSKRFRVYKSQGGRKFCSTECQHEAQKDRIVIQCKQCGHQFERPKSRKGVVVFCGKECRFAWQSEHCIGENHPRWKGRISKICEWCGIEFEVQPYRGDNARFCSQSCSACYRFENGGFPSQYTGPEIELAELLTVAAIEFMPQYYLGGKFYDFLVPVLNLLVEVDGIYWHGKNVPKEEMNKTQLHNKQNDALKTKLAKDNDYDLLRIWGDEIQQGFIAILDQVEHREFFEDLEAARG